MLSAAEGGSLVDRQRRRRGLSTRGGGGASPSCGRARSARPDWDRQQTRRSRSYRSSLCRVCSGVLRHPLRLPWLRPAAERELQRRWSDSMVMKERTWGKSYGEVPRQSLPRAGDGRSSMPPQRHRRSAAASVSAPALRTLSWCATSPGLGPSEQVRHPRGALRRPAAEGSARASRPRRLSPRRSGVLIAAPSRSSWDGRGSTNRWSTPTSLRLQWAKPCPDFRSVNAFQAAWLAAQQRAHPTKLILPGAPRPGKRPYLDLQFVSLSAGPLRKEKRGE